ncbi:hypothetical protein BJV78DRAFT_1155694 [Lactifluus subvellereus]|nr:hypothetical protein BJV78DRAFT_1155694 [Lactifluus subvellereus]
MRPSLNTTSSVPPSTDVSVDPIGPTQNRSVPSLKRAIDALLKPWSRARDRSGRQAMTRHTERLIPVARNHPSQTGGNPDHHLSTATAPSTSEGSPTTTGSHRSSPSTCAQSTRRLAQSPEQQCFDHCDPRSMRWEEARSQEEERNLRDKKIEEKKMKKGPRFSKGKVPGKRSMKHFYARKAVMAGSPDNSSAFPFLHCSHQGCLNKDRRRVAAQTAAGPGRLSMLVQSDGPPTTLCFSQNAQSFISDKKPRDEDNKYTYLFGWRLMREGTKSLTTMQQEGREKIGTGKGVKKRREEEVRMRRGITQKSQAKKGAAVGGLEVWGRRVTSRWQMYKWDKENATQKRWADRQTA